MAAVAGLRAPPYLTSYDAYERLLTALVGNGTLPDRRTLFRDIQLSSRYSTIEVRAADVPVTAEESALLTVLVRALTVTSLRTVERGHTGPGLSAEPLRAARDGLPGKAMDPRTGRLSAATACSRRCCATWPPGGDRRPASPCSAG